MVVSFVTLVRMYVLMDSIVSQNDGIDFLHSVVRLLQHICHHGLNFLFISSLNLLLASLCI